MEIIVESGFIRDAVAAQRKSRRSFEQRTKRSILKRGLIPIKAQYEGFWDCLFCGEGGRCPGYHTLEEIRGYLSKHGEITW